MQYKLTTPVTKEMLAPLRAGDTVLLSGTKATAAFPSGKSSTLGIKEKSVIVFKIFRKDTAHLIHPKRHERLRKISQK